MGTPSHGREKFVGKLLKEWEHIEDEVLIREVATKGKYINILQQFLSKRSGKSLIDIKYYFSDEIDKYVHRLLNNRQVHKAELVLKNVGRKAHTIFYEFLHGSSKHAIDDDIKEHIVEHLQGTVDQFNALRDEYDYYLLVLKLLMINRTVRRQFEDEMHVFTLESLFDKNIEFRRLMATITCFCCKNSQLVRKLDKATTWNYLWKTGQIVYIARWLHALHENLRSNKADDCNPDTSFDTAIDAMFSSWNIDDDMFANIQEHPNLGDLLLNCFSRIGMIADREKDAVAIVFQRVLTTQTLSNNEPSSLIEANLQQALRFICQQNELHLLSISDIFDSQLNTNPVTEPIDTSNEIQLCSIIKRTDYTKQHLLAEISQSCSNYIVRKSDPDFYQKVPHVFVAEQLLMGVPFIQIATEYGRLNLYGKLPVFDMLFQKMCTVNVVSDYDISLTEMLRLRNIDVDVIRAQAISYNSEVMAVGDQSSLITFTNESLCQKYRHATTNNYLDYVKQNRSSYAVYRFFVDQLTSYSQISRGQIQIACGMISELAINHIDDAELMAHCVAFVEMLGVDSRVLRAYLNCFHIIRMDDCDAINLRSSFNKENIIPRTERILLEQLNSIADATDFFKAEGLDALRVLCQAKQLDLPLSFLKTIAARCDWFRFMLFAAYHNFSIRSVVDVCQMDCFLNNNIGLNIGRALKEIIAEDEMPKRRNSFSYREHRRRIQNKADTNHLLTTTNHTSVTNSISFTDRVQTLSPYSFLNINDDVDISAVLLICTCEGRSAIELPFTVTTLKEFFRNTDAHQLSTYANLMRYAIKLKWPILTVLAATTNAAVIDYCWIIWLMTSVDLTIIPSAITTFDELARHVITYAVQNDYVRSLHQSFEIFYPSCKFALFTKFLHEARQCNFSLDTCNSLADFVGVLNEEAIEINSLLRWTSDELTMFITILLMEYIKIGFDSMEHSQQLLDRICASGIAAHVDSIDFCTIAAMNQIVQFTGVQLNIDEMVGWNISDIKEMGDGDTESIHSTHLQNEYIRVSDVLVASKHFKNAIELANLLNLSKDSIIYEQWIHQFDIDQHIDFDMCERRINEHSISPLILIKFYLHIADQLDHSDISKYAILLKALNTIKKHHLRKNDGIHCDRIEYEMYKCLLKNDQCIEKIELYYSEYFETIMKSERVVLFKTFIDLKELASIDKITVLMNEHMRKEEIDRLELLLDCLLDQGDLVQALRVQEIFNHRTVDLHYLVFCMALCENLTSLYDLSAEQKQMLSDGLKHAASKFNKRTLRLRRLSASCNTSASSSPNNRTSYMDTMDTYRGPDSDYAGNGEKLDVLEAIQSLASRVKHGFRLAQRIAMVYRIAMYLYKDYIDVLQTKDMSVLLQSAVSEPCVNRLLVISDIMTSMQMNSTEIAGFMAEQIVRPIIKSRFYLLHGSLHSFGQNHLWDYDLDKDFHLFLELSRNTSMLGYKLLKYCDALKLYRQLESSKTSTEAVMSANQCTEIDDILNNLHSIMENQVLSHKKQNIITVELLIKAHDCFVHECSMEGIAFVLQRCKTITSTLASAKSWRLIVRLLIGIGRYRDMYYCFETLIKNDQFESLLGQFDEDQTIGLKEAIISYLHEHYPDDTENYRLTALHFQMFHELAQISEKDARRTLDVELKQSQVQSNDDISDVSLNLMRASSSTSSESNTDTLYLNGDINAALASGVSFLRCSEYLLDSLNMAMESYAHAAENYLLDTKLSLAQRAAAAAELIAMQIHLVRNALDNNKANCMCVLSIQSESVFRYLINNELNIPQSLILSRAYPFEIIWTEAIFNQYIVQGKSDYIIEYCVRMELTDPMIEHLVKSFQSQTNVTTKMERAISTIVESSQSVILRYRLASLLSDKRIIAKLINGDCLYYLKDSNYGRSEIL